MFVRKEKAGSAPGHTWAKDGDVLEVPDHLGHELLRIPHGGFTEVSAPAPAPAPKAKPAPTPAAVKTPVSE